MHGEGVNGCVCVCVCVQGQGQYHVGAVEGKERGNLDESLLLTSLLGDSGKIGGGEDATATRINT